mgnify:CR=1 FL=1|jgi:ATP-binding cassette subfamily B protein
MTRFRLILNAWKVSPIWFVGSLLCYLALGCITVGQVLIIVFASQLIVASSQGPRENGLLFLGCLYLVLPLINQAILSFGTFCISNLQRGLGNSSRRWFGELLLFADQELLERPSFQNKLSWLMTDLVNKPGSFLQACFNCISPAISGLALTYFMGRTSIWVTFSIILISFASLWNQHWYSGKILHLQDHLNWIRREGSYWLAQIMNPNSAVELKLLKWDQEALKRAESKFYELDRLELKMQKTNLVRNSVIQLVGVLLVGTFGWNALGREFSAKNVAALMTLLIGSAIVIRSVNQLGIAVSTAVSEGEAATQVFSFASGMTKPISPLGRGEYLETTEDEGPALRAKKISYRYPSSLDSIFQDLSFKMRRRSLVLIEGENGTGKTTLLELLAGFRAPTSGQIIVSRKNNHDLRLLRQFPLRLETSLQGNIDLLNESEMNGIQLDKRLPLVVHQILLNWLQELLIDISSSEPETQEVKLGTLSPESTNLSGGQWQRLGIIRTFSQLSAIYILDEPTSNLDSRHVEEFIEMIQELKKEALIIVTSHNPRIKEIADEVISLKKSTPKNRHH